MVTMDREQYDGLAGHSPAKNSYGKSATKYHKITNTGIAGDPTLLGLVGYLIPFQTASFVLLGLRGANTTSLTAISGSFYFFGGLVSIIAGIFELLLRKSFPGTLFIAYGAHWLQTGYQYDPAHGLMRTYATADDPTGALATAYTSGNAFYNLSMCLMSAVFFVGSLRSNAVLSLALFSLIPLFGLLAGGE